MKLRCLTIAFSLALLTFGHASTSEGSPAPSQPLVHRAPANASWTITMASAMPPPAQPSRVSVDLPQSITVEKTGRTYREQTTLQSGKTIERWIYNGMELTTNPENGEVVYVPVSETTTDRFDFSKSDFQGLEWLSLQNYQGVKKLNGVSAFFFEAGSTDPNGKKSSAYLATDSQLPLFFSNGWVNYKFAFNAPPTKPLVPPEKFLKVFRQIEIDLKERHR